MADVEDYLGLITSYHRGRPKFVATLRALVEPLVELQNFLARLPQAFDLDVAIGAQLDVDGIWIGRSRYIPIPIPNVWFSFDDDYRGFDLGVWKGPYDTGSTLSRLDDDTYRTYLRGKIAANQWDGTLPTAVAAYDFIFSGYPATRSFVLDNQNMTMTVGIAGQLPPLVVFALLDQGFLPLKPGGVRLDYVVTSSNGAPLFGFDIETDRVSGFDTGAWGVGLDYYLNP